ncbi:hypothetical protein [Novipirellula artificiosorum]|nr:hypothetical protein [Novipirellula artificiosorum]
MTNGKDSLQGRNERGRTRWDRLVGITFHDTGMQSLTAGNIEVLA